MQITEVKQKTYSMIDDLKSACNQAGAGNSPGEYKIITQSFLYKFLNDKFIYELGKNVSEFKGKSTAEIEAALKAERDSFYATYGKKAPTSTEYKTRTENKEHTRFIHIPIQRIFRKGLYVFLVLNIFGRCRTHHLVQHNNVSIRDVQ